jgi:hypothetical protein
LEKFLEYGGKMKPFTIFFQVLFRRTVTAKMACKIQKETGSPFAEKTFNPPQTIPSSTIFPI